MKPIVIRFLAAGLFVTLTATVSLVGQDVLPKPEPTFDAKIGRTYKDSTPGKITLSTPPAGAPNVLFIMIDDSGFGQWSTFGGQIPTPNLDRLAKMGLRYTRFHTTALCSPTRAALLAGRNHHSVGTVGRFRRVLRCSPRCYANMATARHSSARITISPTGRRAFLDRTTAGQVCRVSITSTDSSGEKRINGSQLCIETRRPSKWISPKGKRGTTR